MKKTIKIGYTTYVEEEVEVDDKFAGLIQKLENAEANEAEESFDDLCESKLMEELITKFQWNYDVVRMMLNTKEESLIFEE